MEETEERNKGTKVERFEFPLAVDSVPSRGVISLNNLHNAQRPDGTEVGSVAAQQ